MKTLLLAPIFLAGYAYEAIATAFTAGRQEYAWAKYRKAKK